MNWGTRVVVLCLSAVMVLMYFFPLWQIELQAPQYPEGLTMYIWLDQITGSDPHVLDNINILNHYIGMAKIEPDSIPELQYMPYIIGGLILFGLGVVLSNKPLLLWIWFILLAITGIAGIVDLYLWEYDYGHNLDPMAPIKIPGETYQPPLLGKKELLNIIAVSVPQVSGVIFTIILVITTILIAFQNKLVRLYEKLTKKAK